MVRRKDKTKQIYRLLGIVLILSGILALSLAALIPDSLVYLKILQNVLGQVGSSLLVFGVLEMVFKEFLQEELTNKLVTRLQNAIDQPVDSIYLRRSQVPKDKSIFEVWDSVEDTIFIKAAAYSSAVTERLDIKLRTHLRKNSRLEVFFLILDPDSEYVEMLARLGEGKSKLLVRESIERFIKQLQALKLEFNSQVHFRTYDSFPTCNIWLVDPEGRTNSWARISPRITENRPLDESIVVFLSRRNDPEYYDELYDSIQQQWKEAKEPKVLTGQ